MTNTVEIDIMPKKTQATTKTKAYAYLRVSGKGQVDKDGFPRQREAIQKYADAHGIEIVQEYRDEGVSGTKDSLDRPALTDLMTALLSDGVRLVVVERADRLARDLIISELILKEMSKAGVSVVDASGTDLSAADDDPTKKLIRQVLAAVAEYEKTALVMKLRAARQRLKKTGVRVEGRKPFGHHPNERPVVARIKKLREEGKSLREIARVLNDDNIPTRTGSRWEAQTISNTLKFNP
jgi:DNA invertase Pin-like site-specific DNA recombinase